MRHGKRRRSSRPRTCNSMMDRRGALLLVERLKRRTRDPDVLTLCEYVHGTDVHGTIPAFRRPGDGTPPAVFPSASCPVCAARRKRGCATLLPGKQPTDRPMRDKIRERLTEYPAEALRRIAERRAIASEHRSDDVRGLRPPAMLPATRRLDPRHGSHNKTFHCSSLC